MGKGTPASDSENFFGNLGFEVPDTIEVKPYQGIPPDEWGTTKDGKGQDVPLPDDWKKVGFLVKYPTTVIENEILRHSTRAIAEKVDGQKGKVQRDHFDVVKLQKYYIYHIIVKAFNTDNPQDAPPYNDNAKEFFLKSFLKSPFLWRKLSDAYYELRQESESERADAQANLSEPSESTAGSI